MGDTIIEFIGGPIDGEHTLSRDNDTPLIRHCLVLPFMYVVYVRSTPYASEVPHRYNLRFDQDGNRKYVYSGFGGWER